MLLEQSSSNEISIRARPHSAGYTNALEAFRKDASASSRDDVSESKTKRVRGAVAAHCAREIVLASLYDGDKGA